MAFKSFIYKLEKIEIDWNFPKVNQKQTVFLNQWLIILIKTNENLL